MKTKKPFRIFFLLLVIFIVIGYAAVQFSWLTVYNFKDMKYNAGIVDSSAAPPVRFLETWDKLYPSTRNNGMNRQLWGELTRGLINTSFKDCKCDEIGYLAWNNDNHHFKFDIEKGIGNYRRFGYGLQHFTTPEKCFNFWLNNDILWKGKYLKDLNELSNITLHKNIDSLNRDEIIKLIAYRKLSYYQAKDSALFEKTVNSFMAKLNRQ